MEYALKLSNVCKEYDSSEFALDNVTFDLPTGTVMGFVGENVPRYILKVWSTT